MTATQTRLIRVQVDTGGAKPALTALAKELKAINNNTRGMSESFSLAKAAIIGFATGSIVTGFTAMADSMQLVQDRLAALTGSQKKAGLAFEEIIKIAKRTNAPLDDIANIYARITVATQRLNLGIRATSELTQVLQQSFRLSGASTEESTASTIQFSQALSFGQLRGQELRSVLSQNAVLAGIFGKAIEGSGKDIYKFAEAGGFTTKFVLAALAKHMNEVNSSADKLGVTFAQTLTNSMNVLKIKIGEINREFDLNGKFASFMNFILDHSKEIVSGLSGIVAVFVAFKIQAGIAAIAATTFSVPLIAASAAIAALVAGIVYFGTGADTLREKIDKLKLSAESLGTSLIRKAAEMAGAFGAPKKEVEELISLLERASDKNKMLKESAGGAPQVGEDAYYSNMKKMLKDTTDMGESLESVANKMATAKTSPQEQLKKLNEQFNEGNIKNVEKYNNELLRLTELTLKGYGPEKLENTLRKIKFESLGRSLEYSSITLEEFNKKTRELKIEELESKFHKGTITNYQYRDSLVKLGVEDLGFKLETAKINVQEFGVAINSLKMEELKNKLDAGKVSLSEFVAERNKLAEFSIPYTVYQGIDDYVQKIGNLSNNISGVITNSFTRMEDALVSFTKNGRFIFADFAQAILEDINRIIIRMMIIQPIAKGLMGGLDLGLGSGNLSLSGANAGGSGVRASDEFASGGVVNRTTPFFNGGRPSVMGEKGSEAILPLRRNSQGDLGVQAAIGGGSNVTVNIVNQTGDSEVTQSESTGSNGERVLDILIKNKVQEQFSNGGMDKTMGQLYGVRRRGN